VDGLTRVGVASAKKNYHDGGYGNRNLEEAAHLKRVVGVLFGQNSTVVLFERPVKTFVLMGSAATTTFLLRSASGEIGGTENRL
jgi:hypothetical protein